MKRREFIRNGLSFVALGATMPTVLMQAAQAAESSTQSAAQAALPSSKILVVIELNGGNDGLNTVIPYQDGNYSKLRPGIGIAARDVVPISAQLGLHPRLKSLKTLFEAGHLAVVNGVGYPKANRSHFESMDIWQTGSTTLDITQRKGWLARYFDADGHLVNDPITGLSIGGSLPLAFSSDNSSASVFSDSNNSFGIGNDDDRRRQSAAMQDLYAQGTVAGSGAEFVHKVGNDVFSSTQEFRRALTVYDTKAGKRANYPQYNGFASGMQTVAKLITGGLKTRVYYLSLGGFDTHANQPYNHANLMGILAETMSAFYEDLTLQGRDKDVAVMTFSEFGRRAKENASAGTDHGAASVMFVAGSSVQGGIYGDYPSLTDL
ncbi:MAG TPA: DUF1501 domain-containing protein, partial [Abditibacteriaceae bacterium]|nr:DUF1501 domain-containing protein [Abditibacteriaceae bacterium]